MNKFNVVDKLGSSVIHFSNCLDDPEKIVSALESKHWKDDNTPENKIGSIAFFGESEIEYKQILSAMTEAATIFLSSTNRDIADYVPGFNYGKVVRWETKFKTLPRHVDAWNEDGERITPDITLTMYLTSDYDGGEIVFNSFDKAIKPIAGDIIAFDSDTWHSTEPFLGGRRMTNLFFLFKK